jgi:hypothetical protein
MFYTNMDSAACVIGCPLHDLRLQAIFAGFAEDSDVE